MSAAVTCRAGRRRRARRPAGLTEEERNLYDALPAKVDYVPHPDYRLAATERELFGREAEDIPVPSWQQFTEMDEPRARPATTRANLSRRQETVLFMRYNYARYRAAALMSAQRRAFSSRRAREILSWHRRAAANRADIAGANMPLVIVMAKRTRIGTVEFAELISEGNLALLRATDKFDVSRGFKFSTYACRAILKAFHRLASKTRRYRQHFPVEFDPEFEHSDELQRRHRDQRDLAIEDLRRVLARNAAGLTEVEQAVVAARFALAGQRRPRTLQEVSELVGLSKERVRQVQIESLCKIRDAFEKHTAA